MAAMMRDWLGGRIDRELRLAIEWSKRFANAARHIKTEPDDDASVTRSTRSDDGRLGAYASQGLYEDDGSNLRVKLEHSVKESWVLQLVEILTYETPIQAVLSDGYTSINATFSSPAVAAFEKIKRGQSFTSGTGGGIFNTERFEIVATPYGPRDQQVSLLVTSFNWIGSGASPTFGRPKPVETRPTVSRLLRELLELRNGPPLPAIGSQDNQNQTESPISPQPVASPPPETHNVNEDASLTSQAPLNTQILPPTTKCSSLELEVMGGVNLACPTEAGLSHHANLIDDVTPYSQNTIQKQVRLLSLLPQRHDPVTVRVPENVSTNTSDRPVANGTHAKAINNSNQPRNSAATMNQNGDRDGQQHDAGTQNTTQNMEHACVVDSREESPVPYEAEAGSRGKEGPTSTDLTVRRSPRRISNLPETPGKNTRDTDALTRRSPATENQSPSGDNATYTGTEGQTSSNVAKSVERPRLRTPQPESPSNGTLATKGSAQRQKVTEVVANPWQNLPRITRAICKIPSNQRAILSKRFSWLPPEPGVRFPLGNIPLDILNQLNQMAQPRQVYGSPVGSAQGRQRIDGEDAISIAPVDDNQNQKPNDDGETRTGSISVSNPSPVGNPEVPDSSAPYTWSESSSRRPSPSPPPGLNTDLPPDSSLPGPSSSRKRRIDTSADASPHRRSTPLRDNCQAVDGLSPGRTPRRITEKPSQSLSNQPPSSVQSQEKHTRTPASAHSTRTSSQIHADHLGKGGADQPAQDDAHQDLTRGKNQTMHSPPSGGSSDEESELEFAVPHALFEHPDAAPRQSNLSSRPIHQGPARASVERSSKLQAEDTPYNALKNGVNVKIRVQRPLSRSTHDNVSSSASNPYLGPTPVVTSSSSAPLIPSTFDGVNRSPPRNRQHELAMDGTSEGDRPSSEVRELVDQQMRNELAASQRSAASVMAHATPSQSSNRRSSAPGTPESYSGDAASSPESRPSPNTAASSSHKRKTTSDRPSRFEGSKKRKISSLHLGFSQESPVSQDPATRAQQYRKDFFGDLERSKDKGPRILPDLDEVYSSVNQEDQPKTHGEVVDVALKASDGSRVANLPGTVSSNVSVGSSSLIHSPVQHQSRDRDRWAPKLRSTPSKDQSVTSSDGDTVFKTFTADYPDYRGDTKHFYGLCRMIDRLQKAEKMQHRSLWDDFIIRHKTDYQEYVLRCSDEGEDPVTYEKFYRDQIEEPMHMERIMNPSLLKQALEEATDSTSVGHTTMRPAPSSRVESSSLLPASVSAHSPTSPNYKTGEKRALQAPHRREPSPKRPYHSYRPMGDSYRPNYSDQEPRHRKEMQRPSHGRAVSPELGDESFDHAPSTTTKGLSTADPSRNVSGLVAPPPTQSSAAEPRKDVPRPHPAAIQSPTSSSRHPIPFLRAPVPTSTSNPSGSRPNTTPGTPVSTASQKPSSTRRSLPWSTKSSTSKPLSPSLVAASTNTSSAQKTHTPSPRVQTTVTASANGIAPETAGRSRGRGRGIDVSEGVGKGFSGLAKRANGARANAQAGDVLLSSSASPASAGKGDKPEQGAANKHWYRDKDTPFKEFVRTWAGLKHVEGRLGTVDEKGVLRLPARKIDVFGWGL